MNAAEYFERKPSVCGGALVVKGTRVPVKTLLASLAEGSTVEQILADFPTLSAQAMQAVVGHAAR